MHNKSGVLIIHLHAHLPFVRHPEHSSFLEEDWLYEAMSECYIPLLIMMERLKADRVPFKLSFTLSPPLCEMLADELLMSRYRARLGGLLDLGFKELMRTRSNPDFYNAAAFHLQHFTSVAEYFDNRNGRILTAFRDLLESGHIEIITCSATHAILPFISRKESLKAQLRVAVENYIHHFGRAPRGIWLPECAYFEGLDTHLAEAGIKYAFLDTHGIMFAEPCPPNGVWSPIRSGAGVHFLGRDIESSRQVWSAREGYPGDENYRDFYRDIGYDAEESYIAPYLHGGGMRHNLGYKYFRVTGDVDLADKKPYNPDRAAQKATDHAANFHFNRTKQFDFLRANVSGTPVLLAPYDAELFGHWWFEGPLFLENFLRVASAHPQAFVMGDANDAIESSDVAQCEPSPSSWGDKGYFEVWLNNSNQWMYPHLHEVEERMSEAVRDFPHRVRELTQMARELLLAQSSDWAFIASTGTTVPYAVRRFRMHISNFLRLESLLKTNSSDDELLSQLEQQNNIFASVNPFMYAGGQE